MDSLKLRVPSPGLIPGSIRTHVYEIKFISTREKILPGLYIQFVGGGIVSGGPGELHLPTSSHRQSRASADTELSTPGPAHCCRRPRH